MLLFIAVSARLFYIGKLRVLNLIAASICQASSINFFIGEEVVLSKPDRCISLLAALLRRKQTSLSQILKVEEHKDSHARTLKEEDYYFCHTVGKD